MAPAANDGYDPAWGENSEDWPRCSGEKGEIEAVAAATVNWRKTQASEIPGSWSSPVQKKKLEG